jgi:hypothetical protein
MQWFCYKVPDTICQFMTWLLSKFNECLNSNSEVSPRPALLLYCVELSLNIYLSTVLIIHCFFLIYESHHNVHQYMYSDHSVIALSMSITHRISHKITNTSVCTIPSFSMFSMLKLDVKNTPCWLATHCRDAITPKSYVRATHKIENVHTNNVFWHNNLFNLIFYVLVASSID